MRRGLNDGVAACLDRHAVDTIQERFRIAVGQIPAGQIDRFVGAVVQLNPVVFPALGLVDCANLADIDAVYIEKAEGIG